MRRSRWRGFFLTGLFLVATANQVGCGVFHCIAEPADAGVPSCHSQAADPAGSAFPGNQEHERSEGACCLSFPAERDGTTTGITEIAGFVPLVDRAALSTAVDAGRSSRAPRETGPPGWSTGAAALPLRI